MRKLFRKRYPFFYQTSSMDCGLACLRMIAAFYGKRISLERVRSYAGFEKTGVSMYGLKRAAALLNLEAIGIQATIDDIEGIVSQVPVVIHWKKDHFVTLFAIHKGQFIVGDPAKGVLKLTPEEFTKNALSAFPDGIARANVLVIEITEAFKQMSADVHEKSLLFRFFKEQVRHFRWLYLLIMWSLLLGLCIQFLLPFFTKNVVDLGIDSGSLKYIGYLLAGQFVLIISGSIFGVLKSWVTLHLSSRINYALIAKFLGKLFTVPLHFFETRKIGDILQRISDHSRVEAFVTRTAISILFSGLTVVVYSSILAYYNPGFFVLLLTSVLLYALWISFFLKKRKLVDWERFELSSKNQSNIIQIVNGIHDLKINRAEKKYFDKWNQNQQEYIRNSFDSLRIFQFQELGATLIFQLSQLGVTFLSVSLVVTNKISFGTMLSIQFIMGQLIIPIQQLLGAITAAQDARLSFDRLNDVWSVKEEARDRKSLKMSDRWGAADITMENIDFAYHGQEEFLALKNVSLRMAKGKTTAIVGLSGSGKTSILKLLLGYHDQYTGTISIGNQDFRDIDLEEWRSRCGVVMQDSYIFNDTIAENICMNKEFDLIKFRKALSVANILEYVDSLPLKHQTMIGTDGKGLSQGQKQRLLIARAVYKDPDYVFFDEATNSLDAENESIIINNLKDFFKGRTVILVAHRLSTIQFADEIVLLQNGEIAEQGKHADLKAQKGRYFDLVKKQMTA